MELDPRYVDVIVERWQNLTAAQAMLADSQRTYVDLVAERTTK
jgi:hypothetical protein